MPSTSDPADRLLDEVVSRLKALPVPDYPGPPRVNLPRPGTAARPPAADQRTGAGVLVVVCSALLLAVAAVFLPTKERTTPRHGLTNVVRHPVRVRTVDLDGRLRALEQELDEISLRLEEIDDGIVTQELLSDSRSLLARYAIPDPETR